MTENNLDSTSDRQNDLETARKLLKKLEGRISTERFRSYQTDSNFLSFIRAYDHLLSTVNTVSRDLQIEELQKEFAEYRELQKKRRH